MNIKELLFFMPSKNSTEAFESFEYFLSSTRQNILDYDNSQLTLFYKELDDLLINSENDEDKYYISLIKEYLESSHPFNFILSSNFLTKYCQNKVLVIDEVMLDSEVNWV